MRQGRIGVVVVAVVVGTVVAVVVGTVVAVAVETVVAVAVEIAAGKAQSVEQLGRKGQKVERQEQSQRWRDWVVLRRHRCW